MWLTTLYRIGTGSQLAKAVVQRQLSKTPSVGIIIVRLFQGCSIGLWRPRTHSRKFLIFVGYATSSYCLTAIHSTYSEVVCTYCSVMILLRSHKIHEKSYYRCKPGTIQKMNSFCHTFAEYEIILLN